MDDRIKLLKDKLKELARKDGGYLIFGASKHRYHQNGRLYEPEVKSFEKRFNIVLPADYREFVLQVTNGGPGPYYGLESLEDSLYQDLDYRRKADLINPGLEFPLTEAWNLKFEDMEEEQYHRMKDEQYFDNKWTNGLLRISNFGCGVSMNLVVNGSEYGNIWVDDRCNDGGIFPDRYFGNEGRITFLIWYELWLDKSLKEVMERGYGEESLKSSVKTLNPWWKALFKSRKLM